MIKWSSNLYFDDTVGKELEKWKKRVESGKPSLSLYCICLASNENNLFDIINCNELLFQYYRRNVLCIVGLSKTREDAVELLRDIVEDIYQKTQDFNVREYFIFPEEG